MATHYDDEAQLENIKRWWQENWLALAAGLVIGLGAIFGWEVWKDYQARQAMQASQIYEDMKKALAANSPDEAVSLGDHLVKDYANTPYAANAALRLAAVAVEQQKLDNAAARLQWVAANSKDDGLKQLAKLRLARVLWQQNKAAEALALLEGEAGGYAALYEELRGDIKLSQGDRGAARAAYEKALQSAAENPAARGMLQQKLDDLADVVQS